MDKIKVLVIESKVSWHLIYRHQLSGKPITLISARTARQVRDRLLQNPDIKLVSLSSCAGLGLDDLAEIAKNIGNRYKMPIIACGYNCNDTGQLLMAGCKFKSLKSYLGETILEILCLNKEESES